MNSVTETTDELVGRIAQDIFIMEERGEHPSSVWINVAGPPAFIGTLLGRVKVWGSYQVSLWGYTII